LIDRYGSSRLGHYRGWLLLIQSCMVLCLIVIGCFHVETEFSAVFAGSVVLAFLSFKRPADKGMNHVALGEINRIAGVSV
jgi:hypothetical protein